MNISKLNSRPRSDVLSEKKMSKCTFKYMSIELEKLKKTLKYVLAID